jgi:hypothetical protein
MTINEILSRIQSSDVDVRRKVAINPKIPAGILAILANDKNEHVRHCVASNVNTPVKILVKLANDEDRNVRAAVAEHPQTPVEIIAVLANDSDAYGSKGEAWSFGSRVGVPSKIGSVATALKNLQTPATQGQPNPNTPTKQQQLKAPKMAQRKMKM